MISRGIRKHNKTIKQTKPFKPRYQNQQTPTMTTFTASPYYEYESVRAVSDDSATTAIIEQIQGLAPADATMEAKRTSLQVLLDRLSAHLYDDTSFANDSLFETLECILDTRMGNMRMLPAFDPRIFPAVGRNGNVVFLLTNDPITFPLTSEQRRSLVPWMPDSVHQIESCLKNHMHVITLNREATGMTYRFPYESVLADCPADACKWGRRLDPIIIRPCQHWSDEACPMVSECMAEFSPSFADRLPQRPDLVTRDGRRLTGYGCSTLDHPDNADIRTALTRVFRR